jgi:hypothetical protein
MLLLRANGSWRALAALAATCAASNGPSFYGKASLSHLRPYGVAVRVACTGAVEEHQEEFAQHVREQLESRGVSTRSEGSVVLKLLVTSIGSDDGFLVVHMRMQLDQAAHLALDNRLVEATTWDAWKMGEYREEDLMDLVDELSVQFLDDYVAANRSGASP